MMDVRVDSEIIATVDDFFEESEPAIPDYLSHYYWWAYVHPRALKLFDHDAIVSAILWGNYKRLKHMAVAEFEPGKRALQAACVYGDLSVNLAQRVGPTGSLDVIDIVPAQVEKCAAKLADFPWSRALLRNATQLSGGHYDATCSFFLLHEVPDAEKREIVDALLEMTEPGGKVVFVDYHRPHALNPIKPITALVFRFLEPFARVMWDLEIEDLARHAGRFSWTKRTVFGGLFQVVVATRL